MKKFLLWLLIIIAIILAVAYVILFTSFGNGILKPHIEKQINKYSPLEVKLDIFKLRINSFEFSLSSMDNIFVDSSGTFSLLSQNIDGILNILIKKPSNIKELESAGIKLGDDFLIENVIRGKFSDIIINTSSNIAGGTIRIDTQIASFSPKKIIANINNINIANLLNMLGQKAYADGKFNLVANIDGDSNLNFVGNANATIADGSVSKALVKQDFNLNIPDTNFIVNLVGDFDGSNVKHRLEFLSNIGEINSSGSTTIPYLKTDSTYDINIENLSPLTPFAGMPLKGSFRTNGKIIGNSTWLNIDGFTDFAQGDTVYSISLEQYTKPKDALVTIKNVKIEEILATLMKPIYVEGMLNANIDLKGISNSVDGYYNHKVIGNAKKGVIKKEFDLDIPNDMPFNHNAKITFNKGIGLINADIISDIANANINNAILNIENTSIEAPYTINIKDLKKIAFLTGRELKGNITANGKVKYSSPSVIYADFNSELFGGSVNATLNNNLANIIIKNMNSMGVLDMLQFKQFFQSSISGNIKYDAITQKGNLELIVDKGSFTPNKLTNLLQNTLNFDATREIYDNIKITGSINKKTINANLDMLSNNTSLTSKNAKIDFEQDNINAYLMLKVQKYELGATFKGNVGSPSISLDTKKLVKDTIKNVLDNPKVREQTDKIEQKIEEQKDKVKDKIDNAITDGLNKLFNK